MTQTGLENSDRSLHKTPAWLNEQDRTGAVQRRFQAPRAVLWEEGAA